VASSLAQALAFDLNIFNPCFGLSLDIFAQILGIGLEAKATRGLECKTKINPNRQVQSTKILLLNGW